MERMTGKERMRIALSGGTPDRVPAAPDISTMIPIKLSGRKFYDVELLRDPPLWKAYINAAKHFGIDGWNIAGQIDFKVENPVECTQTIEKREHEWVVHRTYHTPDGDLHETALHPEDNSFTLVEKMVKNFKEDFPKLKHLIQMPVAYDDSVFRIQRREMGELGLLGNIVVVSGYHTLFLYFHGNLEAVTYASCDEPELFDELVELYNNVSLKQVEMCVDAGAESILTGGSGSITMQSPIHWRKYSLPTIKKISKMCKEAGVICGIHSCGKEIDLLEGVYNETDVHYVNPLEIAPMGDCDLAECKRRFGDRIALMGNLHTTEVMLNGSVKDVRRAALQALFDAAGGGGFVLSTGDQCGYYTPEENIFELVRVAKEFGRYPIDFDRISDELKKLNAEV